tara:strand:+ start:448 stop:1095 length:648 start_codon:yes stop_codon:yes gene_type:complete
MDPRYTSEWSILVSPPSAPTMGSSDLPAGIQLSAAYLGISTIVLFWGFGGVFGTIMLVLGSAALAIAVVLNAIAVSRVSEKDPPARFHSVGILNTFLGKTVPSAWFRGVVIILNVLLATIVVSAFVIGDQLDAAWGCFSGHLSLSQLTEAVCTINPRPERCWDVTHGRGTPQSCTGTRHANVQGAEWTPIVIFIVEWTAVIMLRYKHALVKQHDP